MADTTVVPIADGREVAFCQWGVADGQPLLFLHGTPGGRPYALAVAALLPERVTRCTCHVASWCGWTAATSGHACSRRSTCWHGPVVTPARHG
jgi:hypothetical protein